MLLPQTQIALSELAANSQFGIGTHIGANPLAGFDGVVIGEIPYDPARHDVTDINHLSLMSEVTGGLHVKYVLPRKPINMNIVVDNGQLGDYPRITEMKHKLARGVAESVREAVPFIADKVHTYNIGDCKSTGFDVVHLRGDDYEKHSLRVSDLCMNGLTFVISDFRGFDLSRPMPNSVGIKVNHPAELRIPNGVGILRLGGGEEVNTNKSGQVLAKNAELDAAHQATLAQMERAGMVVASIEVSPHKSAGFDPRAADIAIAQSLGIVQRRSNH